MSLRRPFVQPQQSPERRRHRRFPVELDVRYQVLGDRSGLNFGLGKTVEMGCGGLRISAQSPIPVGKRLELFIAWPTQLDGKIGLQLVAKGRVRWCRGSQVGIDIEHHEFRTRATTKPDAARDNR